MNASAPEIINIIGTAAFTLSGYLVGVRKRLDVLGVLTTSLLTAIGGGLMRDVMVGRTPLVFTQNDALITIFITLLLCGLLKVQYQQQRFLATLFLLTDSLGLVAFTITGVQIGLALDLNLFGVVSLGFVTAVGGGIVRDVMVNDIPMILRKDFYGTVSVIVGLFMFMLHHFDWINAISLNLLLWSGYALRLWAHRIALALPRL